MTKPFKHQTRSLQHSEKRVAVFDMSDAGTGKTYVRIKDFVRRRRKGGGCMLVVSPRSLMLSAWAEDVLKFEPDLRVVVCSADVREKAFAVDADIYVTNHDAATWLAKQKKAFFARFDELAIDESSAFKHHTSHRSRAMGKVVKHFKRRRLLTATPNSRSVLDIWHQMLLLDDGERLGKSFFAFRNSVCEGKQKFGANGRPIRHAIEWVEKDGAREAVYDLIRDITVRHKFEDCVDIPPNHRYERFYELPKSHRAAYQELQETQILALRKAVTDLAKKRGKKEPDIEDFDWVIAKNKAVVQQKLLQLASGAVYEHQDKYHVIDTGRYELVADLVESREHSVIMYSWKHQRDMLAEQFQNRGVVYAELASEMNDQKRADIVKRYQAGAYQTLLVHPKSAAHGLTLTRGTATIWPSPTMDTELFVQGSKRQHRIGQTRKTETITVVAKDTYDERAYYELCLGKGARMDHFLELMKS